MKIIKKLDNKSNLIIGGVLLAMAILVFSIGVVCIGLIVIATY